MSYTVSILYDTPVKYPMVVAMEHKIWMQIFAWKLTCRPWNMLVGRRYLLFRGLVTFQGQTIKLPGWIFYWCLGFSFIYIYTGNFHCHVHVSQVFRHFKGLSVALEHDQQSFDPWPLAPGTRLPVWMDNTPVWRCCNSCCPLASKWSLRNVVVCARCFFLVHRHTWTKTLALSAGKRACLCMISLKLKPHHEWYIMGR